MTTTMVLRTARAETHQQALQALVRSGLFGDILCAFEAFGRAIAASRTLKVLYLQMQPLLDDTALRAITAALVSAITVDLPTATPLDMGPGGTDSLQPVIAQPVIGQPVGGGFGAAYGPGIPSGALDAVEHPVGHPVGHPVDRPDRVERRPRRGRGSRRGTPSRSPTGKNDSVTGCPG